ncbi:hypothetical protein F503_07056 [Ophiostoma piceae UAMH 11346]|uniref:Uncharacterized protein n=1 Tax=Ophiostoma piceae (strain UAMH 11346) TaxID=1262450 RepID=S3D7A7_OPHP1|nr:hypothetical protein F503_07056 [Ophiostoma piceae UAMH 11346]
MSYYYNAHPTPAAAPASATRTTVAANQQQQQQSQNHHQAQQHQQQQYRLRSMKELAENLNLSAFRVKFEAGRSFDLEDDLEFCPGLLTESDLVSIHSASSERSSLASNSPEHSPSQPTQAAPAFSLNASSPSFTLPMLQQTQTSAQSSKMHQPAATRARNPIPIVHPSSRPGSHMSMATPVPSVSPGLRAW